jgi:hypothetical protein
MAPDDVRVLIERHDAAWNVEGLNVVINKDVYSTSIASLPARLETGSRP